MKAEFVLTFSTEDDINEVVDVFTDLADAWHYVNRPPQAQPPVPVAVATGARREVPLEVQPVVESNGVHARPVGPNEYQDAAGRRFLRMDR